MKDVTLKGMGVHERRGVFTRSQREKDNWRGRRGVCEKYAHSFSKAEDDGRGERGRLPLSLCSLRLKNNGRWRHGRHGRRGVRGILRHSLVH